METRVFNQRRVRNPPSPNCNLFLAETMAFIESFKQISVRSPSKLSHTIICLIMDFLVWKRRKPAQTRRSGMPDTCTLYRFINCKTQWFHSLSFFVQWIFYLPFPTNKHIIYKHTHKHIHMIHTHTQSWSVHVPIQLKKYFTAIHSQKRDTQRAGHVRDSVKVKGEKGCDGAAKSLAERLRERIIDELSQHLCLSHTHTIALHTQSIIPELSILTKAALTDSLGARGGGGGTSYRQRSEGRSLDH